MLTATAKNTLACPRLGLIWQKALVERPPEAHAALTVPLQLSLRRCAVALDPIVAELLEKAPRARACIMQAIDPYSGELTDLKATCSTLRGGWVNGETGRIRDRAADALSHGCRYVKK